MPSGQHQRITLDRAVAVRPDVVRSHFGNVPELAWNSYIGGYQPAQKWLEDRKGRKLSDDDRSHYQRIIKALFETDRIVKEIGQPGLWGCSPPLKDSTGT